MSKQRRKRIKRNKHIQSRRSDIRNGVEQLENRVLPGGFLDLLASAAIASTFDLLPEEQLVAEEVDTNDQSHVMADRPESSLVQSDLSGLDISLDQDESDVELTEANSGTALTVVNHEPTNSLAAASFVDSFFASNQFVDTAPSRLISPSPALPNPSRSFSSPISRLGAGVGAGTGQGYNVTGGELPQSNVGSSVASASSMSAWMLGEGEDNGGASSSGSTVPSGSSTTGATSSASSPPPQPPATPPSTNMGDPCSGSASGSASGMASASGYVAISGSSQSADESSGAIEFQVYFYGYAPCGFTVDYSTSAGSAEADVDFSSTAGSISFGPINSIDAQSISVGIINDDLVEGDETFTLKLDSVHDGNGGAIKGNIDIGYGAGSGGGGASGSGSSYGGEATGIIQYDDYNLTYSAGDGAEGGSPVQLTVNVSPEPRHQISVGYGINPPFTPVPALSGADFANSSGTVTINSGQAQKVANLEVNDDGLIEKTEYGTIILSGASSTGDAVHIQTPWAFTSIADNEWRWISLGGAGSVNETLDEDVIDERGWLTLWKDHVDGIFAAGRTGLNSVHAQVWAQYLDANGILLPDPPVVLGPLDRHANLTYDCNSSTGQILRSPGPVMSGTATQDGLLGAGISWEESIDDSDPNIHYVTVQIDATIGYGGTVAENVVLGNGEVGVEFGKTYDWGGAHEYDTSIRLACKKGSD